MQFHGAKWDSSPWNQILQDFGWGNLGGFRTTMKLTQLLDLAWDIMKYWIILIKQLLLLYLISDI